MTFIKVKDGCIRLDRSIFNDKNTYMLGIYSMILRGLNLVNIESDCEITIEQNVIHIKKGKYSIKQLNEQIAPVIITFDNIDSNNIIEIKSPCYYNLDENLKKYLGFENTEFNFSKLNNKPIIYNSNENENYINIDKECQFRIGRNGKISTDKIPIGIYTISEIEEILNCYDFPNIKLELIEGFLNISASIGLCFDEYLSNCLGIDYIGNFITTGIPINKIWPKSAALEQDIEYKVIGSEKPKFYTQGFLKYINGIIHTKNNKIELKGNYSLEQLNSLLPSNIKIQNNDKFIKIITKDYYSFDENLKLSLGFVEGIYTHFGLNSTLNNHNKILEVHCDIIEKSISHINHIIHHEEELLFLCKYDSNNTLIQPSKIIYRAVETNRIQIIKINILDHNSNIINFDEEFIVVLDLIQKT